MKYLGVAALGLVIAQGILGASLAHSNAPLADAMGRISPLLRAVMLAGAALRPGTVLSDNQNASKGKFDGATVRVVAAGGKPGGFSAHGGRATKARLLAVEGARTAPIQLELRPTRKR